MDKKEASSKPEMVDPKEDDLKQIIKMNNLQKKVIEKMMKNMSSKKDSDEKK